jgi:hypothetical protein
MPTVIIPHGKFDTLFVVDLTMHQIILGMRGGEVECGTALHAGRSRVRFPMRTLELFIDIILPAALWPGGRISR